MTLFTFNGRRTQTKCTQTQACSKFYNSLLIVVVGSNAEFKFPAIEIQKITDIKLNSYIDGMDQCLENFERFFDLEYCQKYGVADNLII